MECQECGKQLTNEEDCYGHDCEVKEDSLLQAIIRKDKSSIDNFEKISKSGGIIRIM